jgi:hypothetical protein
MAATSGAFTPWHRALIPGDIVLSRVSCRGVFSQLKRCRVRNTTQAARQLQKQAGIRVLRPVEQRWLVQSPKAWRGESLHSSDPRQRAGSRSCSCGLRPGLPLARA